MKTLQRTLTIVKPDAVRRNAVGDIIVQFEKKNFRILAMKMLQISKHQAEQFYAVHASRPFFNTLTDFMSSGPIVVLALEKENAIADLRTLMGATNPANAEEGTIRKKWASNIEHNAIHGSDAEDTARFEHSFFFAGYELAKSHANGSNHEASGPHRRSTAQDRQADHRCTGRRSRRAPRSNCDRLQ
jgi:nucleoside-diphosphate kinase